MPILEPEIKKGDYVIAIIRNTDGNVSEGVVKALNSRTIFLVTPKGDSVCERKWAQLSEIPNQNRRFVAIVRQELEVAL